MCQLNVNKSGQKARGRGKKEGKRQFMRALDDCIIDNRKSDVDERKRRNLQNLDELAIETLLTRNDWLADHQISSMETCQSQPNPILKVASLAREFEPMNGKRLGLDSSTALARRERIDCRSIRFYRWYAEEEFYQSSVTRKSFSSNWILSF